MGSNASLPLQVDVRANDGDVVIALSGELDLASASTVRPCIEAALDSSTGDILVDLAEVTFIDSSGLAALLEARGHAVEAGRRLRVQNVGLQPRRVLELSGVEEMFTGVEAPS